MKILSGNKKTKTAVFISGRGSNLRNLIKFSKLKNSPITIHLVISSNSKAKGLAFAKNNAAFCYNGNTVHTDNSVNVGHPNFKYTQLSIGGSPSKAHIKRITYYSNRISNTQLRNLTS